MAAGEVVDPSTQVIWLNANIKVGGKPITPIKNLWNAGLIRLSDIQDVNSNLLTWEQMRMKFGLNIDWLWYRSLVDVIPPEWKLILNMSHVV